MNQSITHTNYGTNGHNGQLAIHLQPGERLTWTIAECATALGISKSHAYLLASQNALPGLIRLGNRLAVSKFQLLKYLNGEGNDG